jgi:hypothetical protein
VTSCVDKMLSRQQTALPQEMKELIAAFVAMNPHLPTAKIEQLLGLGRLAAMRELQSLVDECLQTGSVPAVGKDRWSTGSTKISTAACLNGSPTATTIENWLETLAIDQALHSSFAFER